jgi:hypothetical protein
MTPCTTRQGFFGLSFFRLSFFLCALTLCAATDSVAATPPIGKPATVNHSLAASTRPVYAPPRSNQQVHNMRAVPTTLRHVPARPYVTRMAPASAAAPKPTSAKINAANPATHDEVQKAQLLLSVFGQNAPSH